MGLGARHEGAEAKVRDGQHHIKIFVHVAVVEQVVAIQAAEPPWLFHATCFGQVHAPVDVFVKTIVEPECDQPPKGERPLAGEVCQNRVWGDADEHKHRTIPPSHRNRLFVLLINQMVSLIRFKGAVMDDGVRLECVSEFPHWAVHHILMERPFEKRCEHETDENAGKAPKNKK